MGIVPSPTKRITDPNHDEHIAEKEFNSLIHYYLVHKFIPMLQAMKIPDAKAAVKKGMREAREDPCVADG